MPSYQYDANFFDFVDTSSGQSALAFLSRLQSEINPKEVLDVGCGRGVWLAAWQKLGVTEVMGIDGAYVDQERLQIPTDAFQAKDISTPFDLGRTFHLVQCLEVAEHVPEGSSDTLIDNLVRHGHVILFSAAQPGQGGEFHVNEKPVAYWMQKFKDRGFDAFDFPRQCVKGIKEIEPWYRYNTLLFVDKKGQQVLSSMILASLVTSDTSAQYTSLLWKLRCGILKKIPATVVNKLAQFKHSILNLKR